jgi:hypothetical protein
MFHAKYPVRCGQQQTYPAVSSGQYIRDVVRMVVMDLPGRKGAGYPVR